MPTEFEIGYCAFISALVKVAVTCKGDFKKAAPPQIVNDSNRFLPSKKQHTEARLESKIDGKRSPQQPSSLDNTNEEEDEER